MFCADGEYNTLGDLLFQTPEASVRSLFHYDSTYLRPISLLIFSCLYFLLTCWTYGLSVSSGLFVPSLLTGAAWGRLFGLGIQVLFPHKVNHLLANPRNVSLILF